MSFKERRWDEYKRWYWFRRDETAHHQNSIEHINVERAMSECFDANKPQRLGQCSLMDCSEVKEEEKEEKREARIQCVTFHDICMRGRWWSYVYLLLRLQLCQRFLTVLVHYKHNIHIQRQYKHITSNHTSHITHHTSHITHHTSHITSHHITSQDITPTNRWHK